MWSAGPHSSGGSAWGNSWRGQRTEDGQARWRPGWDPEAAQIPGQGSICQLPALPGQGGAGWVGPIPSPCSSPPCSSLPPLQTHTVTNHAHNTAGAVGRGKPRAERGSVGWGGGALSQEAGWEGGPARQQQPGLLGMARPECSGRWVVSIQRCPQRWRR